MNLKYIVLLCFIIGSISQSLLAQPSELKVLNFQADNGFKHNSMGVALSMIEKLGSENGWKIVTSANTAILSLGALLTFDVIVFNNNCGNEGRIFSKDQQHSLQQYIRNGGGFVGIHCAGAIWKEEGDFQHWYEKLIGTKLVDHPYVQEAILVVEDRTHISTQHLPKEWMVTDEWHRFSFNPRKNVNVLISVDENSYEGEQKMGGDHPFTWYQYFDGGRSFFTSLGHTKEMYANDSFQKLIKGGILWAAGIVDDGKDLPVTEGLLLDLDADCGIKIEDGNKISSWHNNVIGNGISAFVKQDEGRKVPGSGRPRLKLDVSEINGHNAVVFHRQELLNENEDAFDHLITGSGYTWFSVMSVYEQIPDVPGVNSFFGNLRNTNEDGKGKYEGIWAGLTDDNCVWMGARNAITFGRWDENNPHVVASKPLEKTKYYLVTGRMGSGTGKVKTELFINDVTPIAEDFFLVNREVNSSKMAIGQERDATNHPGKESFDGEIARFLIYERPLTDEQLTRIVTYLKNEYGIKSE